MNVEEIEQLSTPVRRNLIYRVVLGFLYFFLVMTAYYILKPVRESFFLGEKGYRNLPVVHLLVVGVTYIVMLAYTQASRRMSPRVMINVINVFILFCVGLFWLALAKLSRESNIWPYLAWAYYCWVSVFSVFAVTLFWSVVHMIFSPDEGSWTYGTIGAGGTIGALCGGLITEKLAERIGTDNLLILAGTALVPCLLVGNLLVRQSPKTRERLDAGNPRKKPEATSIVDIFRNSPYLTVLALIVFFTLAIGVFNEYRFGQVISDHFTDGDARTAFYGRIYRYTNTIGLVFSLLITGPVQARFGPRPGMLLYAILVVVVSLVFWTNASISMVFWSAVALQSVAYSIYQASRELCYTTTSATEKFVAKGFIDTFIFRAGAASAALTLIGLGMLAWGKNFLASSASSISYVTIPLAIVISVLAIWISAKFNARIRSSRKSG